MCDNCYAQRVRDLCASDDESFTLSASTERASSDKKAALLLIGTHETVGIFRFFEREGEVTAFFEPCNLELWAHFVACMLRTDEKLARMGIGEAIYALKAMLVEEAIKAYPTLGDIPIVTLLENEQPEGQETR